MSDTSIDIGSRLELFVDDHLIERLSGGRASPAPAGAAERRHTLRRALGGEHVRLRHGLPGRRHLSHVLPGQRLHVR